MDRVRHLTILLLTIALHATSAGAQQRWSEGPEYTVVERPRALDGRLVGSWDLWISGGVDYLTDGRDVYQRFTPGTGRGRIVVRRDGRYQWGESSGRLVEVRPYFAQDHLRYWLLKDQTGSYLLTYDERGTPFRILHTVGGVMATGERAGGSKVASSPAPSNPPTPKPDEAQPAQASNPLGVEWRGGASAAPAPLPTQPNPLGVEWQGSTSASPAPTSTRSNPLDVEWRTAAPAPASPAAPTSPPEPVRPEPVRPEPVRPEPVSPAPVNPPVPAVGGGAVPVAGVWGYQKMRFGPGTDGEMPVRGTLVLRPDGSYRQELLIGEFVNPYSGSYSVAGSDVRVVNPSHEERWTVTREGERLLITVAGTTPPVVYTLELLKPCAPGAACDR